MRAVDTNVLVYAEIRSAKQHITARKLLAELAQGTRPWAIPWPCVYEFLRVVTHQRVFHPPVPLQVALRDLNRILESPALVMLYETPAHREMMSQIVGKSGATGNMIHDAQIAALCLEHGVSELISGDRDFTRFPWLALHNPFE